MVEEGELLVASPADEIVLDFPVGEEAEGRRHPSLDEAVRIRKVVCVVVRMVPLRVLLHRGTRTAEGARCCGGLWPQMAAAVRESALLAKQPARVGIRDERVELDRPAAVRGSVERWTSDTERWKG